MTAADPGPEQEGRLATALFGSMLDHPEPPVPPVLEPVRERGRRLRRARRTRAGLLGAAFTGAAVLLVANVTVSGGGPVTLGPGTGTAETVSFPPSPSGGPSGGPSPTGSVRPDTMETRYLQLWGAVRVAAPQRLSVMHLVRSGVTELLLTEPGSPSPSPGSVSDGVRLGVRSGLRVAPGQSTDSPCARVGPQQATECVHRVLSDGSSGWIARYGGKDPRLDATFASRTGTVFGLSVINPTAPGRAAMTLTELVDLVSQAPVHTALLATQEISPGGPSPQPSGLEATASSSASSSSSRTPSAPSSSTDSSTGSPTGSPTSSASAPRQ
ncbi:hypothetical protein ACIA8O_25695 [Kitasatospora sp. NPDC051853]|uniref:hypothetical protein n=1 Tax=Kitasatospora sp. NPDC051853 TaxID=3364058 RepID=UPI0037B34756